MTAAVQNRLTTSERLRVALQRRQQIRHRRLLDRLPADVADGAQSPLEVDYLREVERPHGLPIGRRQVRWRNSAADVLYEEYGLLIELDGRLGHIGRGRFRDMHRDNLATGDGLATLRYGHLDILGRPCEVAFQVARNLDIRGWSGPITRCSRCRQAA